MNPTKAVIEIENGTMAGTIIPVLFNPNEYTIERGTQYASSVVAGLSEPVMQFISGNASTLTMELFFDTYEDKTDVRTHTDKIVKLVNVDSELHAPPLCTFIWGTRSSSNKGFKGILERVTQKYTMFLSSGIPVRARLNVTFRSFRTISEQLQEIPRNSPDRTKQRVLNQGEQLWMLAEAEYQDPSKWRDIAKANNIDNPRLVEGGKMIIVPRLV